ncbi:MAG: hypothetical protein IPK76_27300, partial [Lewinellaceae bacterium]|nr:hypothetical protein [Lewinellaceae bacterium]
MKRFLTIGGPVIGLRRDHAGAALRLLDRRAGHLNATVKYLTGGVNIMAGIGKRDRKP